jgi:hypothetical protein
MVDTGKVEDFRKLRFVSLAELRVEIDRLVAADERGTLRRSGNWTLGQMFGHLAAWINYGYEGYPMKVPWFIRFLVRRQFRKYVHSGLPRGFRIPKVKAGTYGTEVLSTPEGARRLRAALDRLEREPAVYDSPALGEISEADRIQLTLRHAELHLGYAHPC